MKPLRIAGETRRLAEDQPEYDPLSIRDEPVVLETRSGPQTVNGMAAAFQPTPDEIERIKAGAPIYLRILGDRWPPVSLWAGDAPIPISKPDDDGCRRCGARIWAACVCQPGDWP